MVRVECCVLVWFFFSSRRRHTRCALVTGVQTCALPIWPTGGRRQPRRYPREIAGVGFGELCVAHCTEASSIPAMAKLELSRELKLSPQTAWEHARSEERRVGKECVSTCRSRWSPSHEKNTNIYQRDPKTRRPNHI